MKFPPCSPIKVSTVSGDGISDDEDLDLQTLKKIKNTKATKNTLDATQINNYFS